MSDLKLYLQNEAAGYEPSVAGTWDDNTPQVYKKLGTSMSGSASSVNQTNDLGSGKKYVVIVGVSDALAGAITFTATDAITGVLNIYETSTSANAYMVLHIWVTQGDSATPRGTLLSAYTDPDEAYAGDNQHTGEDIDSATIANTVNAQIGDRVVLEFGVTFATATTTRNANLYHGGTAGDATDGGAYNLSGWINLPYTETAASGAKPYYYQMNQ